MNLEIFNCGVFTASKAVLPKKIMNKTQTQKDQKNFLQNRTKLKRVGALRVSTDYYFFPRKIASESLVTYFNLSRDSC